MYRLQMRAVGLRLPQRPLIHYMYRLHTNTYDVQLSVPYRSEHFPMAFERIALQRNKK